MALMNINPPRSFSKYVYTNAALGQVPIICVALLWAEVGQHVGLPWLSCKQCRRLGCDAT